MPVYGTGEPFSFLKFFRGYSWIVIAAAVGIGSVAHQLESMGDIDWTGPVLIPLIYAAVRNGLRYANREGKLPPFLAPFLCACLMVSLAGCVSVPWTANPLKSQGYLKIKESPKGDFLLEINDNGDGTFAKQFTYNGEGPDPWEMTLGVDTEITSPALTASVETLNNAVLQIPELLSIVGPAPEGSEARAGWVQMLFGFLGNNPDMLTRLLGLLTG